MEVVSNRHVGGIGPCRPVAAGEVVPALQLILASGDGPADEAQAVEFMRYTAHRGISLSDVWVVPDAAGRRLLWAGLPMVSPGRTMLLFAAPAAASDPDAVSSGLDAVCRHHGDRRVQLAQALLDPADTATAAAYARCGFAVVAELLYLQRSVRRSAPIPPRPAGVRVDTYAASNHAAFATAILASYRDSLDCPPLNGLRRIEDVMAGHRATGAFDAGDWFLLRAGVNDAPLGVLLLARATSGDGMELVYLGLAPVARGLGLGGYLMRLAEGHAAARKARHLALAVDAANHPAIHLYHRHGLQQTASKLALVRELGT